MLRPDSNRYQIVKIILQEEGDDLVKKYQGEWQVIDMQTKNVLLRFPWSTVEDDTDWPKRFFHYGPQDVCLSEDGEAVHCFYSLENKTGFKFEGQDRPYSFETFKLP